MVADEYTLRLITNIINSSPYAMQISVCKFTHPRLDLELMFNSNVIKYFISIIFFSRQNRIEHMFSNREKKDNSDRKSDQKIKQNEHATGASLALCKKVSCNLDLRNIFNWLRCQCLNGCAARHFKTHLIFIHGL